VTLPSFNSTICVSPVVDISSIPLHGQQARPFVPSMFQNVCHRLTKSTVKYTYHLRFAFAGLVSGPRILNTVRKPISRLICPTRFIEGWNTGASMNPMPESSRCVLFQPPKVMRLSLPKLLKYICASWFRCYGIIAVLCHRNSCPLLLRSPAPGAHVDCRLLSHRPCRMYR